MVNALDITWKFIEAIFFFILFASVFYPTTEIEQEFNEEGIMIFQNTTRVCIDKDFTQAEQRTYDIIIYADTTPCKKIKDILYHDSLNKRIGSSQTLKVGALYSERVYGTKYDFQVLNDSAVRITRYCKPFCSIWVKP